MDSLLSNILAAVLSPVILLILTTAVKKFADEGLIVKFLGGVSNQDFKNFKKNIELASGIHIESGVEEFGHLRGASCTKKVQWLQDKGPESRTRQINYNNFHFKEAPKVLVSFSRLDLEHRELSSVNTRISVKVLDEPGRDFFVLRVSTWEDSYVHQVRVTWIAYGN